MELFDTYTKELVDMPLPPGPVRMYICGPTVYARAHVGNARPFVIGMWWRQWLKVMGYTVKFVHNITDINDKIYAAAGEGSSSELAKEATEWYIEDTESLGLGMPDEMPKVSQNVPVIVEFIEELIENGHAYEVDGDVYFRVASFPDYGKLSGRWVPSEEPAEDELEPEDGGDESLDSTAVEDMPAEDEESEPRQPTVEVTASPNATELQGDEEEADEKKEDPRDFALWKAKKQGEDTSWNSPWGKGRPGWHIECSAMAENILGEAFEIHGGGIDLLFPHHENELAQSRALGHRFAADLGAQRAASASPARRCPSPRATSSRIREALDEVGPRGAAALLPLGPLAQAGRLLRRHDGAGAGPGRDVPQRVHAAEGQAAAAALGRLRRRAGGRLRHAARAGGHARVGVERPARQPDGGARDLRAQVAGGARAAAGGDRRARRARVWRRARPATTRRPIGCGPRSTAAGWEMRDSIGGYVLRPKKT